jgi:5-methylcytosine-specific restriction protein A
MDSVAFRKKLREIFALSTKAGKTKVVVNAGELHRLVGGYPGTNHRMPVCCSTMRSEMRGGDTILQQPPKGNGASLSIEYYLPR